MNEYRIIEDDDGWIVVYRNGRICDEGRMSIITSFLRNLNFHLDELEEKGWIPTGDYPTTLPFSEKDFQKFWDHE